MVVLAFILLFLFLWGALIAMEPLVRGSLARTAHLTAKFRYRDYLPVLVLVIAGGFVAVYAGDSFVDLAELVHSKSPVLQVIDRQWHDWAVSERYTGATTFFAVMSVIGGPVCLGVLTGLVAAWLVIKRRFRWAIYVLVTAGGGALLLTELKLYFERARPVLAEQLRRAHGYSFPSGHAMGSTVVAGALTYLAMRVLPTWRQKAAAIAFAITFVISVAASRVYLGVHWLSDIAAGIAGGLLWVMTTTLGYETSRRIRLIRALRARRERLG
ncbi:MAG TPA: phosphatase PAP2 family protein [Thermoanaerobaculia bacterium]|nr:phosphatase PAP2 family protein [Thermoanaerobaculia bacterium]